MQRKVLSLVCILVLTASATAQQTCSVFEQISQISPSYARVLRQYLPGINTSEEAIDGPSVSKTFLIPSEAVYSQYVANVTFGYTSSTAERIFNESVLIQTLPEALTLNELIQGAENFRNGEGEAEHYGYDTFSDDTPYLGNNSGLFVGHSDSTNASSPVVVYGPIPQGDFDCLLYLDCSAEIIQSDIQACESYIHVLDNPLAIRTFGRSWQLDTTPAAEALTCTECSKGGPDNLAQNCGSAFEHTGCSCCNRYY